MGTAAGDIGVAVGVHDFVNGEVSETLIAVSKQEHPNYDSVSFGKQSIFSEDISKEKYFRL